MTAGVMFMDPCGWSCVLLALFCRCKTSLYVIKVHIPPNMGLGIKVLQQVLIIQCTSVMTCVHCLGNQLT